MERDSGMRVDLLPKKHPHVCLGASCHLHAKMNIKPDSHVYHLENGPEHLALNGKRDEVVIEVIQPEAGGERAGAKNGIKIERATFTRTRAKYPQGSTVVCRRRGQSRWCGRSCTPLGGED